MLKRIKKTTLGVFILLGLVSCNQTNYSFKAITNKEIKDINRVTISYSPMMSAIYNLEGDYGKIFDIKYTLSNISYNDARNIIEDYKFHLFLDFNKNNANYSTLEFYVYKNKMYYFDKDNVLYESFKSVNYHNFNKVPIEGVKYLNLFVNLDYGIHIENKATLLLDWKFFWFDLSEYELETLVAGDELRIGYSGDYMCTEVYPGTVIKEEIAIHSIELIKAEICEFVVTRKDGSGEVELLPVDAKYSNYILLSSEGNVVFKDGTFKKYSELPIGTKVYGSLPRTTGSVRVDGLYAYNPRP